MEENICNFVSINVPANSQQILEHFNGSVQERCNSSGLAMELHLSCTYPLRPVYVWDWTLKKSWYNQMGTHKLRLLVIKKKQQKKTNRGDAALQMLNLGYKMKLIRTSGDYLVNICYTINVNVCKMHQEDVWYFLQKMSLLKKIGPMNFMHSISWLILLAFGLQHLSKIAIMISEAMVHGIPW